MEDPSGPLVLVAALIAVCLGGCGAGCDDPNATREAPVAQDELSDLPRLANAPLCEASAMTITSAGIWVADNELEDRLFLFPSGREGLRQDPQVIPLGPGAPHDIEALATDGANLLVVGSHSRRRGGRSPANRKRIWWLSLDDIVPGQPLLPLITYQAEDWRRHGERCQGAFDAAPESVLVTRLCTAIDDDGMDIEGAAFFRGQGWLGFRRPVVDGYAFLARLSPPANDIARDGREGVEPPSPLNSIARVDLGGRGIRSLAPSDTGLWLIAGPEEDGPDAHRLFHVDLSVHPLEATDYGSLPTSAEGLIVQDGEAYYVVDGAADDEDECATPARWGHRPVGSATVTP